MVKIDRKWGKVKCNVLFILICKIKGNKSIFGYLLILWILSFIKCFRLWGMKMVLRLSLIMLFILFCKSFVFLRYFSWIWFVSWCILVYFIFGS